MKQAISLLILIIILSCEDTTPDGDLADNLEDIPYGLNLNQKPIQFYTPTDEYFEYTSDGIPTINDFNYSLKIHGQIDSPVELTLDDLKNLPMTTMPVTIECIGNFAKTNLIGTAIWKGFSVEYLLDSLGMDPAAKVIKYVCADGYYSTTPIEILRSRKILGALYMNGESIPLKHGYPLRVINPGFYGVKNPGWVTEIEVLGMNSQDYWDSDGWKTSEPMAPDSKIFFPPEKTRWSVGDTINFRGAAFGSNDINIVEISFDNGKNWQETKITQRTDDDFVWIFWSAEFIPKETGDFIVLTRATDENNTQQPRFDNAYLDGNNAMPEIYLYVR